MLVLAGVEVAGLVAVWWFFVRSAHGHLLDTVALAGNRIGQTRVEKPVDTVLNTVSVLSLVIATAVIGFIALIRRRIAVAFGGVMLLVVGANLTTQLLKEVIDRPQPGIDLPRGGAVDTI